ncbi:MAG TPA: DNA gyrase inhibitor YacG [Acetobacteraceae bacterium]|nr:DNA gyrase inhibitor YacG [Acetobacteraceae bacterium]
MRLSSCPICGKPTARSFRPFCSRHCADVDLGRWLTGQYRIPSAPDERDEGDEPGSLDRDPGIG